ncbi:hypothetical protein [Streptomyces lateritius]|nr:hypothetical protein [Streptomyces lateritius]
MSRTVIDIDTDGERPPPEEDHALFAPSKDLFRLRRTTHPVH